MQHCFAGRIDRKADQAHRIESSNITPEFSIDMVNPNVGAKGPTAVPRQTAPRAGDELIDSVEPDDAEQGLGNMSIGRKNAQVEPRANIRPQ
jgi:hypothetical protein